MYIPVSSTAQPTTPGGFYMSCCPGSLHVSYTRPGAWTQTWESSKLLVIPTCSLGGKTRERCVFSGAFYIEKSELRPAQWGCPWWRGSMQCLVSKSIAVGCVCERVHLFSVNEPPCRGSVGVGALASAVPCYFWLSAPGQPWLCKAMFVVNGQHWPLCNPSLWWSREGLNKGLLHSSMTSEWFSRKRP